MDIRINCSNVYTRKNIKEKSIVTLSDVHFSNDFFISRLFQLINILKEIKPDVICIPGDFLDTLDDSITQRQSIIDILKEFSRIAKTCMSFAAHDYSSVMTNEERNRIQKIYFSQLKNIDSNFIPLLPDEKTVIDLGDTTISGYSLPLDAPYYLENIDALISYIASYVASLGLSPKDYNILSCHSPISFFDESGLKSKYKMSIDEINLILSGHYHAGLMPKFLQFLNCGLIAPGKKPFTTIPHNIVGLFSNPCEDFNVAISRGFLKIPGTVKTELGSVGKLLYQLNNVYKPDIDFVRIKKM